MEHNCHRCGGPCKCDQVPPCCDGCGCDVMSALMAGLAKVPGVEILHNPWPEDPDDLKAALDPDDDDPDDEDWIVGYCCLGCGHVQNHGGECEMCTGYCVEPYG